MTDEELRKLVSDTKGLVADELFFKDDAELITGLSDAVLTLLDRVEKAERRVSRLKNREQKAFEKLRESKAAIARVRELVTAPCTPDCCEHCDGKNEGWEMVLNILDREGNDE